MSMSSTAETLCTSSACPDRGLSCLLYVGEDRSFGKKLSIGVAGARVIFHVVEDDGGAGGDGGAAHTGTTGLLLACRNVDVVILDVTTRDAGLPALLHRLLPERPVVVVDENPDPELGEKLLREGAQDYLPKKEVERPWFLQAVIKAVVRQNFVRSIDETRRLERYLAYHDSLTRLPNRQLFSDRLTHLVARARRTGNPLAVLFIDLDGFKQVNDRYGHAAGDQLLIAVAERLKTSVRASETAARYGGDEFVVILDELPRARDAALVAERIQESLRHPVSLSDLTLQVGSSIGIALFPSDGDNAESLVQGADEAMYLAKTSGGGYAYRSSSPAGSLPRSLEACRSPETTARRN